LEPLLQLQHCHFGIDRKSKINPENSGMVPSQLQFGLEQTRNFSDCHFGIDCRHSRHDCERKALLNDTPAALKKEWGKVLVCQLDTAKPFSLSWIHMGKPAQTDSPAYEIGVSYPHQSSRRR
jgi:hypothetical protein